MTKSNTQQQNVNRMSFPPTMTKIHNFLKQVGDEYCAKVLAKRLQLKYNTVREYLRQLTKGGYLSCRKVDGINFYRHKIPVRKMKRERPELKFHDIVLKFNHQGQQFYGFPGWWKQDLFLKQPRSDDMSTTPHEVVTTGEGRKIGEVSFQQGKENLMVYYGGSGRPLNWEEFMAFLRWLGRKFRCHLVDDPRWTVAQLGTGTDFEKTFFESFGGSVSIHSFLGEVARVYHKELDAGKKVIRTEFHTKPNMTIAAMIETLRGGLSTADSLNLMARQAVALEEVPQVVKALAKKIDRLVAVLYDVLERRNGKEW